MIYNKVTPTLPTKFRVSWPFGSGEEAKHRFFRWQSWRPSWISDRNDCSNFLPTRHPDASFQVSSQSAQGCGRSRILNQFLTPHDARRATDDGRWTLTDHNSSPSGEIIITCTMMIYGETFKPPVVYSADRSMAVVLVLFLLFPLFFLCVVMLALWSPSSIAAHFAFCLTRCVVMLAFCSPSTAAHFAFCFSICD